MKNEKKTVIIITRQSANPKPMSGEGLTIGIVSDRAHGALLSCALLTCARVAVAWLSWWGLVSGERCQILRIPPGSLYPRGGAYSASQFAGPRHHLLVRGCLQGWPCRDYPQQRRWTHHACESPFRAHAHARQESHSVCRVQRVDADVSFGAPRGPLHRSRRSRTPLDSRGSPSFSRTTASVSLVPRPSSRLLATPRILSTTPSASSAALSRTPASRLTFRSSPCVLSSPPGHTQVP